MPGPTADYWIEQAERLEARAALIDELVTNDLDGEWASDPIDDDEVRGRHGARVSLMGVALNLYRRAGDHRRTAYKLYAATKPAEPEA